MNVGDAKNGTEIMVHTLRTVINRDKLYKNINNKSLIQYDIYNAFNEVFRRFIRTVIKIYCPEILSYFDLCYHYHSNIYYTDEFVVKSKRGFQQGDGLAIFFPLCIYHIFKKEKKLCECLLNIYDNIDKICQNIDYVNNKLSIAGMKLNVSKTKLFMSNNNQFNNIYNSIKLKYPNIKIKNKLNFEIMGSFIGDFESTQQFLNQKYDEYCKILDILKQCDEKHIIWTLLYYCLGYAKNNYLLRTIPDNLLGDFCNKIDNKTNEFVQCLIGTGISSNNFNQIRSSFFFGGMGLRALKFYNKAAFQSSWNQCSERIYSLLLHKEKFNYYKNSNYTNNIKNDIEWQNTTKHQISTNIQLQKQLKLNETQLKDQKIITRKLDEQFFESYYNKLNHKDKVRINGCRAYAASTWISSLPLPYYLLTNDEFIIITRLWLGINIISDLQAKTCKLCDHYMDPQCIHAILCIKEGQLTRRHNRVRNYLFHKFKAASYIVKYELYGLLCDQSKPADIYCENYHGGKHAAFDVAITSPIQQNILEKKNIKLFMAADHMRIRKNKRYDMLIDKNNIDFIPLIFEAYGGIPPQSQSILKRLASDLSFITRKPKDINYNHIKRMIVFLIWKSNVTAVLDRIDNECENIEDFV